MQCGDVREMADSFLSEELLVETTHEILRHLEQCPSCRAELESRRGLRAALRAAIEGAPALAPRPEFISTLSAHLRAEALRPRRTLGGVRAWFAGAAAVLVLVAVGLAVRGGSTAADLLTLARHAVGDHSNCAVQFRLEERPISLADAGRLYDPGFARLEALQAPSASLAGGDLEIVERHACVFRGRRFAHVVLRYRGSLLSLLIPAAGADIERLARSIGGGRATAAAAVDGFDVAWFVVPGHVAFLVSPLGADETQRVAAALAGPVSRLLARS